MESELEKWKDMRMLRILVSTGLKARRDFALEGNPWSSREYFVQLGQEDRSTLLGDAFDKLARAMTDGAKGNKEVDLTELDDLRRGKRKKVSIYPARATAKKPRINQGGSRQRQDSKQSIDSTTSGERAEMHLTRRLADETRIQTGSPNRNRSQHGRKRTTSAKASGP